MVRTSILTALIGISGLLWNGCKGKINTKTHEEFKPFFAEQNVEGCCMIYDPQQRVAHVYNPTLVEQPFTPASTFKIFNSLVGLETGVIPDIDFVIPWDSVQRGNQQWNRDHDLQQAFKNSTVWYYQELARRVGPKTMHHWLQKSRYGNADTSGGIDQFWLRGGLRISVKEQIQFLQKLQDGKLQFSKRSVELVKSIMHNADTLGGTMRGKTGWGVQGQTDIGWYVGYFEKGKEVFYFANCIQTNDSNHKNFGAARVQIIYQALQSLGITSKD